MKRIIFIGSGSKGNSTLIEYKENRFILIDCGFSIRYFNHVLEINNLNINQIDYIFITHNHIDHIKMINKLDEKKIYSFKNTIQDVNYNFLNEGVNYFCDFEINVIKTSHDAPDSIGFIFKIDDKEIVYLTDLGFIKKSVLNLIKNKDYYILESNHDIDMLLNSNRPKSLINRIKGRSGHLSNQQAIDYLNKVINDNTKHIFLAHLSQECNNEDLLNNYIKENFKYYKDNFVTLLKQIDGSIFYYD